MKTTTRTNKQVFDIPGTITGPDGLRVEVRFDLLEMEDFVEGMPSAIFSYGVLRYCEPLDLLTKTLLLSATRLILTGGGMQTALCLYRLTSFTLADTIREFRPGLSIAPVAQLEAA